MMFKPTVQMFRLDKRHLHTDFPTLKTKKIKLEATNKDVQPPNPVSYLPNGRIPVPPQPPASPAKDLAPPTPSVIIETAAEANSARLQEYCLAEPISVVRGLANALQIDLGLYTTKSLVETQPDHQIEVRTQLQQASDEKLRLSLRFDSTSSTAAEKHLALRIEPIVHDDRQVRAIPGVDLRRNASAGVSVEAANDQVRHEFGLVRREEVAETVGRAEETSAVHARRVRRKSPLAHRLHDSRHEQRAVVHESAGLADARSSGKQ